MGDSLMHSNATALKQILIQETPYRLILEKTVKQLKADFEGIKKLQSASDIQIRTLIMTKEELELRINSLFQVKRKQDLLNRQLLENITLARFENEVLKQELLQLRQIVISAQNCKLAIVM